MYEAIFSDLKSYRQKLEKNNSYLLEIQAAALLQVESVLLESRSFMNNATSSETYMYSKVQRSTSFVPFMNCSTLSVTVALSRGWGGKRPLAGWKRYLKWKRTIINFQLSVTSKTQLLHVEFQSVFILFFKSNYKKARNTTCILILCKSKPDTSPCNETFYSAIAQCHGLLCRTDRKLPRIMYYQS